ncbi:hypothetical protein C7271_27045 [filamentous cyanobacterium CCP5]|nr:hypothetical protein C7271_27045 [filamentous cyanobacterium CCP5]
MLKTKSWTRLGIGFLLASLLSFLATSAHPQRAYDVRVDRWLTIKQATGEVIRLGSGQRARVGDRLTAVGEGIRTGASSSSVLEVDTGIGTINVSANTEVRIRNLSRARDGGRITRLQVPRGNVRLNLRRFTHSSSELEIETPSGISGVRGTEFGLTVQPSGASGVATLTGSVYAEAQAVEVTVPDGFQTLIRPGEPPLEPTPIPAQPAFDYQVNYVIRNGLRRLELVGRIDPINQVFINGDLQALSREGRFSYEVPAIRRSRIDVTITTPLGDAVEYDIPLL